MYDKGSGESSFSAGTRQHLFVPPREISSKALQYIRVLSTEICLFVFVGCEIEQVSFVAAPKIFPLTSTHRVLIIDAPEKRALPRWLGCFDYRQQVNLQMKKPARDKISSGLLG
ncbi:MAG TPA: hypothetical protein VJ749_03360 [Pyrinomonadaceae bacterium]|nr:hypothetical protein [Pyrinomonadaceae bacterium]